MITVVRAGPLTTVQDMGRPGLAHLGVPRSGAADRGSHRRANALVGNPEEAATLETTLLGCALRAEASLVVAVAGARCEVFVGGVPAPWGAPFRVGPGQTVDVGPAHAGLRSYVAVRGGIDVAPVLASRSTDRLSGLGPEPLADGHRLPTGAAPEAPDHLFGRPEAAPAHATELELMPGPRHDWLASWAALTGQEWRVGSGSDRVGVRLEGSPLARSRDGEIASEGIALGAVQLPPSGHPVLFLADHPTTGGYPVIGVLTPEAVDAAAQARPGASVTLVLRGGSA